MAPDELQYLHFNALGVSISCDGKNSVDKENIKSITFYGKINGVCIVSYNAGVAISEITSKLEFE